MKEPTLVFNSRRSPVYGRKGMTAASQPLAASVGMQTLWRGGTAADAAVAMAAVLNVVEPVSTGLGGDAFVLYFEARTGQVHALNGSGRAPAGLTLERLQREGMGQALPPLHAHTVTVPGAAAAWCDLLGRFGRLPVAEVLAPAAALAEEGAPVAPLTAYYWQKGVEKQLSRAPGGIELTIEGRAPRPGEVFRNPGLARSLRILAEGGRDAFYRGEPGRAIAAAVQGAGGCLTEADLAAHVSTWDEPISTVYRGLRFWECPPNGQGLAALLALNLLAGFEVSALPARAAKRLHLEIEAMRLAFADARRWVSDPAFGEIPLKELLSPEYAAGRRKLIDPGWANPDVRFGRSLAGSGTVYLCAVDGEGNGCSFINSNYMGFGTGIVPAGFGFSLQNRGHNFSLDPTHPNTLAPGKRPYHTIIPGLITRPDGGLFGVYGVMGGFMQPQGHLQVASALADDGLDPQAALDRLRFSIEPDERSSVVALEEGIAPATVAALERMGHNLRVVGGLGRSLFGRGQVILREEGSGVLAGGSDPRADGCALAW